VAGAGLIPGLVTGGVYWFGDSFTGLLQPRITKVVLHSTETPPPNCPGYSAGASAPTLTINPWAPMGWQHFLANMSARALADPAGTVVRENRDDVAQIEIIGYADYRINPKYALANIPESGLQFIANVLRFYNQQWGLPLVNTLEWPAFNSPRLNQVRLSGPQYDAYQGVLGHMHVSGNDHVDPAGLNINRIMQLATGQGGTVATLDGEDLTNIGNAVWQQIIKEGGGRRAFDLLAELNTTPSLAEVNNSLNSQTNQIAGLIKAIPECNVNIDIDTLADQIVSAVGTDLASKVIDALGERIKPGA
jgi:hypothetical protein